jgi:hypothetical protein
MPCPRATATTTGWRMSAGRSSSSSRPHRHGAAARDRVGGVPGWAEYADHHRLVRDSGREDPRRSRLASIWMGRAAGLKQAALGAIADKAGVQLAAA